MRRASSLLVLLLLAACRREAPERSDPKGEAPAPARPSEPGKKASEADATSPGVDDSLQTWSFETDAPGGVPEGFRVAQTNAGDTPATWAVVQDPGAPSPPRAFGVTAAENEGQFNLAIVEGPRLADVDVQVMVRAVAGTRDQGGGLMFRVSGPDDYYVARWNPLEHNARFYVVQGGARSALAKVETELPPDAWHPMRIVAEGSRMELYLDDRPVLTAEDTTFAEPGGIGLWTKNDAQTLFDDLTLTSP